MVEHRSPKPVVGGSSPSWPASYFKVEEKMFRKIKRFLSDVVIELKKTTWPSREDVIGTTIVTIVMVAFVTTFLWIVDMLLARALNFIFSVSG